MSVNRQGGETAGDALHWSSRIVTAEALSQSLNGQRRIVLPARALITPLAAEQLRSRGVQITREENTASPAAAASRWGYAQERPDPIVQSAVQALERAQGRFTLLAGHGESPCRWVKAVADCVARGECQAGAVFGHDAGMLCCVANKVRGIRAVAVTTAAQASRATRSVGANLLIVEMPGRTFFEVRQILQALCAPAASACPPPVAAILEELEGYAHR